MSSKPLPFVRETGFTLLELLVALALMTLVAVLLTQALGFGRNAWQRAEASVQAMETVTSVRARLREWLERAYPFNPSRATRKVFYPLRGEERSVVFSTPLAPEGGNNTLYRVELKFDDSKQQLLMRYQEETNNTDRPDYDAPEELILEGVGNLRFSYLEPGTPARWVSNWLRKEQLPKAIKIQMKSSDLPSQKLSFPDLIIRPAIDGLAWCDFDPVSRDCRSQGASFAR